MDYIYVEDNQNNYHVIDYYKHPVGLIKGKYNRWKELPEDEKILYDEDNGTFRPLIKIDTSTDVMVIITEFINEGKLRMIAPSPIDIVNSSSRIESIPPKLKIAETFYKHVLDSDTIEEILYILSKGLNISILWTQIELEETWARYNMVYDNVIIEISYTMLYALAKYYRAIMNGIDPESIDNRILFHVETIYTKLDSSATSGKTLLLAESNITIPLRHLNTGIVVPDISYVDGNYTAMVKTKLIDSYSMSTNDGAFTVYEKGVIILSSGKKLHYYLLNDAIPHFSKATSRLSDDSKSMIITCTSSFFYCISMKIIPIYPARFSTPSYSIISYDILGISTANQTVVVGGVELDTYEDKYNESIELLRSKGIRKYNITDNIRTHEKIKIQISKHLGKQILEN